MSALELFGWLLALPVLLTIGLLLDALAIGVTCGFVRWWRGG